MTMRVKLCLAKVNQCCCWLIAFFTLLIIPATLADFVCNFEQNQTCGYEWQANLLPFSRVDEFAALSTVGMMLLDLKQVNQSIAPGGRLFSRYYPSFAMPSACLTIKFLIFGPGLLRFGIIQRNSVDRRIYEYDNDWYPAQPSNRLDQFWITLTIPVDLKEGDVMFFFEVITDGFTPNGLFALDHVAFLYYKCSFKQMHHYPCLDESCTARF